jgi:hypothetical protein
MIALVAVATIFIAPSIDLPDGVLREHSVLAQVSGSHVRGSLVLIAADSVRTHQPLGETRVSADRQFSDRGYDDQRPHVLRC